MRLAGSAATAVSLVFTFLGASIESPARGEPLPDPSGEAAKKVSEKRSAKAAQPPPSKEETEKPADLGEAVKRIIQRYALGSWRVGVAILDETGNSRVAVEADRALSPASNQKILVVGAALGLFGPDFPYVTTISAREPPKDGAVKDLVVKGTGDPNISGRFQNDDPTAIFRSWAEELKAKGLRKVTGDLVVDDFYFDDVRFLPGWREGQQGSWYEAEVGALALNDNCVDITVQATAPGQPAKVVVAPATSYVKIENSCRTVEGTRKKPLFNRKDGTNTVIVTGEIPAKGRTSSTAPNSVTIEDPGLYFGTVLAEVLRAGGIAVDGKVLRGKQEEMIGSSPTVLIQRRSTLSDDLKVINKNSQNLHAEILLKALGARKGGQGSVAGGIKAIAEFLEGKKIPAAGLHIEDGSGLSPGNRVSPLTLVGVLRTIQNEPFFRMYRDSLPIAAVDGTLKRRFKGKKCAGHVFAKTGYIKGVSALSGYVERGKRHWVFSVIINAEGLRAKLANARKLEEEIAEAVYLSMPE